MLIKLIEKASLFHDSVIIYKNHNMELTLHYHLITIYIHIEWLCTFFLNSCFIIFTFVEVDALLSSIFLPYSVLLFLNENFVPSSRFLFFSTILFHCLCRMLIFHFSYLTFIQHLKFSLDLSMF